MNFVTTAIRKLRLEIPNEILEMAFKESQNFLYPYSNRSVDSFIENTLLKEQFLEDVTPYLSPTVDITVHSRWIEASGDSKTVIRIPLEATNYRKIVMAMELFHGPSDLPVATSYSTLTAPYGFSHGNYSSSQVLAAAQQVMTSQLGSVLVGSTNLEILDVNVILFHGLNKIVAPCSLRCKLAMSPELQGITIQYHQLIAQAFVQFVKAKIHVILSVKIDKAAIAGGYSIGIVSDIVQSYADAAKNYEDLINTLIPKLGVLANPKSKRNHIRNMIGAN